MSKKKLRRKLAEAGEMGGEKMEPQSEGKRHRQNGGTIGSGQQRVLVGVVKSVKRAGNKKEGWTS